MNIRMLLSALLLLGGCTTNETDTSDRTKIPTDGSDDASTVDDDSFKVAILSASIAEDCAREPSRTPLPEPCVSPHDCFFPCQQSGMRLMIDARDADPGTETVRVVRVELLDASGDDSLELLSSSNPEIWTNKDGVYEEWDEQLSVPGEVTVGYDLSAPAWKTIGKGNTLDTFNMTFRLRVTLEIGSTSIMVVSDEIMREPIIVT